MRLPKQVLDWHSASLQFPLDLRPFAESNARVEYSIELLRTRLTGRRSTFTPGRFQTVQLARRNPTYRDSSLGRLRLRLTPFIGAKEQAISTAPVPYQTLTHLRNEPVLHKPCVPADRGNLHQSQFSSWLTPYYQGASDRNSVSTAALAVS